MDSIPIPLTNDAYALDFCAQITGAQIDFHPADMVILPPELGSLPDQRAPVRGRACVGLGCPDAGTLAGLPAPPAERPRGAKGPSSRRRCDRSVCKQPRD